MDAQPAPGPAPVTRKIASRVVVVGRLAIPDYWQARSVRFRAGAHTVDAWPDAVWAERIEVSMTRQLAAGLQRRFPQWVICAETCPASRPDARLFVDLNPLDYHRAESALTATARWSLATAINPVTRLSGSEQSYRLASPANTAQGQAAVLGELLQRLGDDIAASLE